MIKRLKTETKKIKKITEDFQNYVHQLKNQKTTKLQMKN